MSSREACKQRVTRECVCLLLLNSSNNNNQRRRAPFILFFLHFLHRYNDHHLERILLGNNRCMKDTVVVKAHPMHCGSKCMDDISSSAVAFKKCGPEMQEAGLDVKEFGNKAVILLREPFRAIWSDFQRSINLNSRVDHHRMKINRTSLLQNQFFWDKYVQATRLTRSFLLTVHQRLAGLAMMALEMMSSSA